MDLAAGAAGNRSSKERLARGKSQVQTLGGRCAHKEATTSRRSRFWSCGLGPQVWSCSAKADAQVLSWSAEVEAEVHPFFAEAEFLEP